MHTPDDLPKNIDRDNLLRDGKVFAEYVMTFLTEPVVPLNFCDTVNDIIDHLKIGMIWLEKNTIFQNLLKRQKRF